MVFVFDVFAGWLFCHDHSCRAVSARHAVDRARVLQPDDHPARTDYGIRGDHAFLCRPGKLVDSADDRCARYGPSEDEQLELLDSATGLLVVSVYVVYGRWCAGSGLDFLCPTVDNLCRSIGDVLYFLYPCVGAFFHYGLNQYHRDGNEYACSWHDLYENAVICVDVADNSIPVSRCNAGARGCGDHDVNGRTLWH